MILKKLCKASNVGSKTTRDIVKITQTIIRQNYFRFQDTIYVQNEGLAMGAPTSSILSEICLKYTENTTIYDLLLKHKVEGYFRYVDDILVMYSTKKTTLTYTGCWRNVTI
jgi:hypothetical protein